MPVHPRFLIFTKLEPLDKQTDEVADGRLDSLPGVGKTLKKRLLEAGVSDLKQLALHLPKRYEDRRRLVEIASLGEPEQWVLLQGRVEAMTSRRARRRGLSVQRGLLVDDTGAIAIVAFNQPWLSRFQGHEVRAWGLVQLGKDRCLQLSRPELQGTSDTLDEGLIPVYGPLAALEGTRLAKIMGHLRERLGWLGDPLPEELRDRYQLPEMLETLRACHAEGDHQACELEDRCGPWRSRLAFDELLLFLAGQAKRSSRAKVRALPVDDTLRELARAVLPFPLTPAQRRVCREIADDLAKGVRMQRLLQGDVGAGKTVVAALVAAIALGNDSKVALMAPTELLAEQHHATLTALYERTPIEAMLLTGSLSSASRCEVVRRLAAPGPALVVGTHALISSSVELADLGLVIIDEQHRFGVAHRQALLGKGEHAHLLVMTATPIPRSLALTVYGDLEISVLDELPPGRRQVRTAIREVSARRRIEDFIATEIASGARAYVVCPVIEPSENLPGVSVQEIADRLGRRFGEQSIAQMHGRLTRQERAEAFSSFRLGQRPILVATTMIEVGVDVPEATVMLIEGADRFGLAQLHQLRGRVGRSTRQGWCVVIPSESASEESMARLDAFVEIEDGFELAQRDLALRGPGEVTGRRQWGPSAFRFASVLHHQQLIEEAREAARWLESRGELESIRESLRAWYPWAEAGEQA